MSTTNLAPGTEVPKTGIYYCTMCEHGDAEVRKAMADYARQKGLDLKMLDGIFAGMGVDGKQSTARKRFNAGERFDECPRHKNATGWTLEKEEATPTSPHVEKEEKRDNVMMECPPFSGQVFCSDNECTCSNTKMPPAKGYLWIKQEVAETRMKCLSLSALQGFMTASGYTSIDELRKHCLPIVVCEQAAKRHGLDVAVAAADYEAWVKTGKVPCRATPLVKSNTATPAPSQLSPVLKTQDQPDPLARGQTTTSVQSQQPPVPRTREIKKRPTSVTVIAWYLIVMGVLGLIANTVAINNPMIRDSLNKSPVPMFIQFAMTYISLLITFFSGIAMLKGHGWARLLYVIWSIVGFVVGVVASPMKSALILGFVVFAIIAFFLFRPKANDFFSSRNPIPMIDLSPGQFVFQEKSLAAICDRLKAELPGHVEVSVIDKKPPNIRVRDGLWRGASLIIDDTDQQMKLAGIIYYIPSLLAKFLILATSIVVFSIIVTIICTALIGEFVPVLFGIGGAAGFGGYTIIKVIVLAMIKSSWAGEVHQAIAKPRG